MGAVPRRRPNRLRVQPDGGEASRLARERGLPGVTAEALEGLGLPELDPLTVAAELATWRQVADLPASVLTAPHNDWVELIGPSARSSLEAAAEVLSRREGAPLRAELARLDAQFLRKTSHDPGSDPELDWWWRRRPP